jgi:3-polyprenyl-4-hydroxybenzoate decarboxylase
VTVISCALTAGRKQSLAFLVEQIGGPLDQLDHAPSLQALGGKLGLDATRTWPGEGYPREWPEVARMSDEVRARVDERWDSLGIALPHTPATASAPPRGRRGWRRS